MAADKDLLRNSCIELENRLCNSLVCKTLIMPRLFGTGRERRVRAGHSQCGVNRPSSLGVCSNLNKEAMSWSCKGPLNQEAHGCSRTQLAVEFSKCLVSS